VFFERYGEAAPLLLVGGYFNVADNLICTASYSDVELSSYSLVPERFPGGMDGSMSNLYISFVFTPYGRPHGSEFSGGKSSVL